MKKYIQIEKVRQSKALYFTFFQTFTKGLSSSFWEQTPESYLYENYNNNYYMDIYPFS